jgi:phosphatidylcholine synthase
MQRDASPTATSGPMRKSLAWGVHLLTASGVVWGLLSIRAVFLEAWVEAFAWMTVAVVVDGIDGTFARWVQVKRVLPGFDGTLLDNVIDYLNYVFVPALFLYSAGLVPPGTALITAASISLASTYQFCQDGAKTEDHFFKGFPSFWNVVVFYLVVLGLGPVANLTILGVLLVLVFVPIKYVYPTRTVSYQRLTLILTTLWAVAVAAILWLKLDPPAWLLYGSLSYLVYYVVLSLYLNAVHRPTSDHTAAA